MLRHVKLVDLPHVVRKPCSIDVVMTVLRRPVFDGLDLRLRKLLVHGPVCTQEAYGHSGCIVAVLLPSLPQRPESSGVFIT